MNFISMFSGIEAASVAFAPMGWKCLALAEIEKFPSSVLAHHYPDVPNVGDMTKHDWSQYAGKVDLVVGGPPCQAFSVAGLRNSLGDDRGQLSLAYMRAIHAIKPRNAIVENVPGWLSTKDNAFGCFLGAIVGSDEPLVPSPKPAEGKSDAHWKWAKGRHNLKWPNSGLVSGPKGRAAWTIKDAQYFGLAQRRRRVFVVSDFGNGADPAAVLFELEGVRGNPAPSREKREDVTHPIAPSLTSSGRGVERGGYTRGQDPVVAVLRGISDYGDGMPALRAKGGDAGGGSEALVASKWPAEIASTLNAHYGDKWGLEDQHALGGAALFVPAVSVTGDISHTLKAEGFDASEDGTGRGNPIIAFQNHGSNVEVGEHTTGTLLQNSDRASGSGPCIAQTVALRGREGGATAELGGEVATALRARQGGGDKPHVLTSAVRRLTPVECERLQGFPDDYTRIPMPKSGKKVGPVWAADGPRYKALGNSMAVPVMRWIGERIERFMPRDEVVAAPARRLHFRADGRMELV